MDLKTYILRISIFLKCSNIFSINGVLDGPESDFPHIMRIDRINVRPQ